MSKSQKKIKVVLLCGLPGSGKSTYAQKLVDEMGFVKVSRDDIRMLTQGNYNMVNEPLISSLQDAIMATLLKGDKNIVVDNTHYKMAYLKEAIKKYASVAEVSVAYIGSELSIDEIKRRNMGREKSVPNTVIDFMLPAWKHIQKNNAEVEAYITEIASGNPVDIKPYKQNENLPKAIIVDIDGTVADMGDRRGPFDWKKVGLDEPVHNVLNIVRALSHKYHVFFVSGRDGSCEDETENWLDTHYGTDYTLLMRPAGNFEKDSVIKERIFKENFEGRYYIEMLFDDRDQVVRKYREMGLTVAQVAYGDF